MPLRYLVLRCTPSGFEKPQATYRTQATRTVGSVSMRPSPYLPRFSLLKGQAIPRREIYYLKCTLHDKSVWTMYRACLQPYRCCYCLHCDRTSNAKSRSEISVDFEEITAHIEAAANTFGSHLLRTRKKKTRRIICWFPTLSSGFACVIELPKTCPAMI